MATRLAGKVAIITGGASGIGAATAKLFARHGAKVIIADIQDELGHHISNHSPNISYTRCDVTKESDIENTINNTVSKHGKLDIMYSNAGIITPFQTSTFLNTDKSQFEKVFDVNVYGAFLGAKHAARVMIPEKKGSIIFTSNNAAVTGVGLPVTYVTSKYAVIGLTNQLCLELGKFGIRVNCVSPFFIATPMAGKVMGRDVDKEMVAGWVTSTSNLKGTIAESEDVAEAVVYLGSDESKYVSGLNLVVDGGYSRVNPMITMAMSGVRF